MATTDHPESVHDDVGTPVEVQARDEQMISGGSTWSGTGRASGV